MIHYCECYSYLKYMIAWDYSTTGLHYCNSSERSDTCEGKERSYVETMSYLHYYYNSSASNDTCEGKERSYVETTWRLPLLLLIIIAIITPFFPLLWVSRQVRETYSLIKSLALIIQGSQSTKIISSSTIMQSMIMLLTADLNVEKSLLLHEPSHYFSEPVAHGEEAPAKTARTRKDHSELSRTAQETRAKTYAAVFKRFGQKRWGKGYERESHLFDMVLALNPSCRSLGYVDKLSTTKGVVGPVKHKVWAQLESMVEEVIVVERAAASPVKRRRDDRERPRKRLKVVSKWDKEQLEEMAGSGMFDAPLDGDEEDDGGTEVSPTEEASIVIRTWREAKVMRVYIYIF